MLPGGGGGAGMQGGEEAGVQAEGAGMQQCGEVAVLAGASWKGSFLDKIAAQYSKGKIVA